jgi:similar to stage IV sporulation protein
VKLLLLLRLWNYLRGYVIIIVEGYFVEKFINICTRRQILLWDVVLQQDQAVTMKLSINGFKMLRPIARKTKCRVRLLSKIGLPFVFNRYRRRKAFFAGALLFILSVYAMTSFIWSVDITGNKELPAGELERALAGYGIRTGVLKYTIDTDKAASQMLLERKEITWISISVSGTRVKVDLRERIKIPEIIPNDVPCDVVATKDGMIKRVIATAGVEAVGEGDTVRKGQVLISGKIPLKEDEKKFKLVHAMGSVPARTWYEETEPVVLSRVERLETGKVVHTYTLNLFSWKLDLLHRKPKFEEFRYSEEKKKLSVGENLVFPIEWVTGSYIEERPITAHINEEDARNQAASAAYKRIQEKIPEGAGIVKKDIKFVQEENGTAAKVMVECVEDIGMSRKIGGN